MAAPEPALSTGRRALCAVAAHRHALRADVLAAAAYCCVLLLGAVARLLLAAAAAVACCCCSRTRRAAHAPAGGETSSSPENFFSTFSFSIFNILYFQFQHFIFTVLTF